MSTSVKYYVGYDVNEILIQYFSKSALQKDSMSIKY